MRKLVVLLLVIGLLLPSLTMAQTETLRRELGKLPNYLSTQQEAKALLYEINNNPFYYFYVLYYITDKGRVKFSYNRHKDGISKLTWIPNKPETEKEVIWEGYGIYRLEQAANEGSLNDTPIGTSLPRVVSMEEKRKAYKEIEQFEKELNAYMEKERAKRRGTK